MIHTETLPLPPVRCREVLRYAGAREETAELAALLEEALSETAAVNSGKVCWAEFPITVTDTGLDLGVCITQSKALQKSLAGCDRVILFAATVGLTPDRLIARYSRLSPARALLMQAIGAERIEALCDAFCEKMRQEAADGQGISHRFSPGYGDFPLETQRDIFRVLDCPRKIGLTLNDSLLMSPSKSVTAVFGIGPRTENCPTAGCARCAKTDCIYRRTL